jgi:hypothetical protein
LVKKDKEVHEGVHEADEKKDKEVHKGAHEADELLEMPEDQDCPCSTDVARASCS